MRAGLALPMDVITTAYWGVLADIGFADLITILEILI
jgi:hypothetical protein